MYSRRRPSRRSTLTSMPRALASASTRSIWWRLPSTRATQSWLLVGIASLRLVEEPREITAAASSSTTDAVTHFFPRAASGALFGGAPVTLWAGITSSGVLCTGSMVTATFVAMRLRLDFSPLESLVASLPMSTPPPSSSPRGGRPSS